MKDFGALHVDHCEEKFEVNGRQVCRSERGRICAGSGKVDPVDRFLTYIKVLGCYESCCVSKKIMHWFTVESLLDLCTRRSRYFTLRKTKEYFSAAAFLIPENLRLL